jgi:hypothetical protein
VAPETHVRLAAMREVANLSAQSALGYHVRAQMLRATRSKLSIVVVGLLAGSALLWMWGQPGAGLSALLGAVGAFLAALVWGIGYAVATGRLGAGESGQPAGSEPAAAAPPQPTDAEDAQ